MSFTLCTSGAIVSKAGTNVNSTAAASAALLEQFSTEAEAQICAESRYDWVTNFSSLQSVQKEILGDICSSLGAIKLINFDMSGYTSRSEAETMLDVWRDNAQLNLNLIKDQKVATFIKTG